MSLKHGGDTRPWVSLFKRAQSIDRIYEALVGVLTARNKLHLVGSVNRSLNKDIMEVTQNLKEVFECLEVVNGPTLHLVGPYWKTLEFGCPNSCGLHMQNYFVAFYFDCLLYTSDAADE